MPPKQNKPGNTIAVSATSENVFASPGALDYAQKVHIDLTAPPPELWTAAKAQEEMSKRHFAALGLLLLTLRDTVEPGTFTAEVQARGFESRQAQLAMSYARFVFSRSAKEQAELLQLPHTKVCALAAADPEIVDALLEDGDLADLADLSVRDLRQHIRDTEAKCANLSVERDTLAEERDALARQLKTRRSQRGDDGGVPAVVADIRAEAAALIKRMELSLSSLHATGQELAALAGNGDISPWVNPSARLMLSGLVAQRLQIDGLLQAWVDHFDLGSIDAQVALDPLAFLSDAEITQVAQEWDQLTALHQHEAALREYERSQAKPRDKGRPRHAPVAPKTI